jgi:AcrR family transcriptional regulator
MYYNLSEYSKKVNHLSSKKNQILKTALELFTEQGYSATTTKQIAQKSGVAEGLIFYYFKDKNELLKSLTRELSFIESIKEEMNKLTEMEPVQALIEFGHLYRNFLSRHKNFLSFIWSPEMVQNKEVSGEVLQLVQSMSYYVTFNLTRAVSSTVDKQLIETAASMFLSSILTHVLIGERVGQIENKGYIDSLVQLILKGLT